MKEKKHISDEMYTAFMQERLNNEEQILMLDHISQCDYCLEKFTAYMETELIPAPVEFKENVLTASKKLHVQIVKNAREMSKGMKLLLYGLKVGAATIGAFIILLLFMNVSNLENSRKEYNLEAYNQKKTSGISIIHTLKESTDSWSNQLFHFSNDIIKMEDSKYDK